MPKNGSLFYGRAPVICTACPPRSKTRGTSTHKCAFCYFSYPGLAHSAKA